MGKIDFVRPADGCFVPAISLATSELVDRLTPDERKAELFVRHPGGANDLQLFETRFPPGAVIQPHAHEVDEIIYITGGELHVGKQVYGEGSSIKIPRMTLYAFVAGPTGVTFLNFRPTQDLGVIGKAEFLARRNADGS